VEVDFQEMGSGGMDDWKLIMLVREAHVLQSASGSQDGVQLLHALQDHGNAHVMQAPAHVQLWPNYHQAQFCPKHHQGRGSNMLMAVAKRTDSKPVVKVSNGSTLPHCLHTGP